MGLLHSTMKTELEKRNPSVYPLVKVQWPNSNTIWYAKSGTASTSQGYAQGKVLRWGALSRSVALTGTEISNTVFDFDVSDTDFEIAAIVEGAYANDIRGSTATLYLASPNVSQANWFTLFEGVLDTIDQSSPLVYTLTIRPDDQPLLKFAPKPRITQADWSNASAGALGSYVPLVYGTHNSNGVTDEGFVPCPYVDSVNYTYLVAYGLIKNIKAVYADTGSGLTKLSTSTWSRSNQTKNGKSFTTIDFSSATYDDVIIAADVDGYEADGDGTGTLITDPSDQLKHFLVNFVWNDYKTGAWFSDSTAPIDTTHFATTKTFMSALGFEGSWYVYGDQRQAIEILNEWLATWQMRAFWTNGGDLAVLPLDYTTTTVYIDDPWLRGDRDDLGSWSIAEEPGIIDRVTVQYMYGNQAGQYHQTLEVRDPALDEEAAESLQMAWSAARLV